MGFLYAALVFSFIILLLVNIVWSAYNLYLFAITGIQNLLKGTTFVENVYLSTYLKWILSADLIWITAALSFVLRRKHYKTDVELHYLIYKPILEPKIIVIIPAYNEELVVENVIKDYQNQKNVKEVIVIDNHSSDHTVKIAKQTGAKVITKDSNKGFAHSCVVGFSEALKTDANIIVTTECDGTFSAYDIEKMMPYLDNCDMVIGTRQVQVLTEKGNQNSMFYVWGNFILAKLIQLKYFSLLHMGVIQLTDVGCMHRCIRRNALEEIIEKFTYPNSDEVVISPSSGLFAILMTMIGIENNLKIVEVPITFKKRVGISKTQSDKKLKAIRYGVRFLWHIVSS